MTEIRPENISSKIADIANALDKKDGQEDGKINASIWNEFVKDKGGKEIKYSISLENAKKSISTYLNRKAGEAKQDLAQTWLEGVQTTNNTKKTKASENASEAVEVKVNSGAEKKQTKKEEETNPKANTPKPEECIGALDKYNNIKTNAKELAENIKTAYNNGDLEDFAGGDYSFSKDITSYDKDAIAMLLTEHPNEANLLLGDMSNSRKVKLMKELDPEFKKMTVTNDELIAAAKKQVTSLKIKADVNKTEIDKTKEVQRQNNIKNLTNSFQVKSDAIKNDKKTALENVKNKAKTLETAVTTAIKENDLEDFATGDYIWDDDIENFGKDELAYYIANGGENAQLLLADMSNSRKVKLMKELDKNFKNSVVTDEALIAAAKKHTQSLTEAAKNETNKINNLTKAYNDNVKTIAEMQFADATKLKKTETTGKDSGKTVTVTYGDKVIVAKFAAHDATDIEEIKIGNLTIKTGQTISVSQNNTSINIGSKNIEQIVRQIIQKAKA